MQWCKRANKVACFHTRDQLASNPIIDNFNLLHLEDEYSDKGDQKEAGNGHF